MFPFNACVAQPISRKDVARIPAAKAAMQVEWDRLFEKKVWDIASVMEWDDVAGKARRSGKTVDFGYVFGICVLKTPNFLKDPRVVSIRAGWCFRETASLTRTGRRPSSRIWVALLLLWKLVVQPIVMAACPAISYDS